MTAHGTISRYVAGCHCTECRRANAEYRRPYNRAHQKALRRLQKAHYDEYLGYLGEALESEGWQGGRRKDAVKSS